MQPAGGGYPSGRMSQPSYARQTGYGGSGSGDVVFIPLPPTQTPDRLDVYKELRDNVPDISDGIWIWVRMTNSGHDVNVFDRETGEQVFGADARIRDLARTRG